MSQPITFCAPAYTPAHQLAAPTGSWEYALAAAGAAILVASFIWGARVTLYVPAEAHDDHIKRRILDDPHWEANA